MSHLPAAASRGLSLSLMLLAGLAAEDVAKTADLTDLSQRIAALERKAAAQPATPGGGALRLTDLSLNVLTAAGGSTATDEELPGLQGGGHDPSRRGFTFQGAELSIGGAVDPFFSVQAHLVAIRHEPEGSTGIELEEAYARTTRLPGNLEVKVGQYLTEFGRFNPTHPHAWQFIDQPIVLTRVFGGDGMRAPGARLLWGLPTPWVSEVIVGLQDANGETLPSFYSSEETGSVGGRPWHQGTTGSMADLMSSARWMNSWDLGDGMVKTGASAARGPNAAGDGTSTTLAGADLAYRWHPAGGDRGWPFLLFEGEVILRDYRTGDTPLADGSTLGGGSLKDRGGVLQVVYGFHPGWSLGLRGERSTGTGESVVDGVADRSADPLRDDRTRASALVAWQPSEFTHFRLQYNRDQANHLDEVAHSVWLGAEFLIGAHPAHRF